MKKPVLIQIQSKLQILNNATEFTQRTRGRNYIFHNGICDLLSSFDVVEYHKKHMDISNTKEKLAYNLYQTVISLLRQQSSLFLELGYTLKKIKEDKSYRLMGDGGFETWGRFLAQPEIGIKPSTAYFYIQIYDEYVKRLDIDDVKDQPFYKLQKLLPVVRKLSNEDAVEVYDRVMPMGANDFNEEIKKLKGDVERDEAPKVIRCQVCNEWVILAPKEKICQCQKN